MSNPVYKIVENDIAVLKIHYDGDVSSPREDLHNLGTMVCWHNRYSIGDEHNYADGDSFIISLLEKMGLSEEYYDRMLANKKTRDDLLAVLERQFVILPIYGYDHGSLTIKTLPYSCSWDSGQLGWIYVSKEKIRKKYGVKRVTKDIRESVLSVLKSEISIYDQYLQGDIYGFVIEDKDGNHIDSCGGFYGSDPIKNGMRDHIADQYADLIEQVA